MKAVVFTEYGPPDVLHIENIPTPVPNDNEILVRVHATPVNYGDLTARNFANISSGGFNMPAPLILPARMSFGWNKPKINILGSELAGEVEAVGTSVSKFKPGDQVVAYTGMKMGANAEYICLPETGMIARKPANLTFEEASTLPYGAVMASSLLRKARFQPGLKVLINGASGGVGSMAVRLAKHWDADVTGVCGTERMHYVRSLGADTVIDYTKEDFTRNGETYDLIFDVLGRSSFQRAQHSLKPNGILFYVSFKTKPLFQMLRTSLTGGKKVICAMATESVDNIVFVSELAEAGKIKTIIDRCFPIEQTAEAHRYVESGVRKGSVVITV